MHMRLAHDALFADVFAPCLELRLDQSRDFPLRFQQGAHRRQHLRERYEGDVDGCEVDELTERLGRHMADVRALHVLHACVRAKFPRELTVADVDGVDLRRAVLQGAVRKAARRCADVRHRLSRK